MAVVLIHGPAGSYKSASIVAKHIIPALREGRVVVTNVEGMYPKKHIEKNLGEKFPWSAQLIRIDSTTQEKQDLWRNWFSWMPFKAMIVIDEIQEIYPIEFKSELQLRPLEDFKSYLPNKLIACYQAANKSIKVTDFDEGDFDDTGETRFNDDGSIIRPLTLNGAYKRHRKYNWDIIIGTPNIDEVSKKIRGVAEKAFSFRARDELFFTRRKPRIFEHSAKVSGTTTNKQFVTTYKVPLWVHLCYKSTQTGEKTKSGVGQNPLKSVKFICVMIVLLCSLIFMFRGLYHVFFKTTTPTNETPQLVDSTGSPDINATKKNDKESSNANVKGDKVVSNSVSPVDVRGLLLATASTGNRSLEDLPYGASEIYLVGYTHPTLYIFQLKFSDDEETFQVNSDDLFNIGFTVKFESSGLVLVLNRYTKQKFYCVFDPHFKSKYIENNKPNQNDINQIDEHKRSNSIQNSAFSAVTG